LSVLATFIITFLLLLKHAGTKICDDSSKERWLFVGIVKTNYIIKKFKTEHKIYLKFIVKSGSCRVLKKIRFDKNALSYFYAEAESRRKVNIKCFPKTSTRNCVYRWFRIFYY